MEHKNRVMLQNCRFFPQTGINIAAEQPSFRPRVAGLILMLQFSTDQFPRRIGEKIVESGLRLTVGYGSKYVQSQI